ncbi:MAG: ATP-binding cassette domain-containing protein [Pseudomonadota bacterium]
MSAVSFASVFKDYAGKPVLEKINLDIGAGEFCTMVGPSGCGKTTMLRMLLGETAPSRGTLTVDGAPLAQEPGPDRGIVFQRYSVFPHLSVLDNVVLGLELRSAPLLGRLFGMARREALDEALGWLECVGLAGARDAWPAALSGGMQQRLALAQALILKPKILLLDEPFGALDPGIRADMHDLLHRLWLDEGMTVFMVTHDLGEAFALGTRVLVFDKVRHDPTEPDAYGATIVYDLPIKVPSTGSPVTAPAQENQPIASNGKAHVEPSSLAAV